jgi:hypothetical protein
MLCVFVRRSVVHRKFLSHKKCFTCKLTTGMSKATRAIQKIFVTWFCRSQENTMYIDNAFKTNARMLVYYWTDCLESCIELVTEFFSATNGGTFHPPSDIWIWRTMVEWHRQGKSPDSSSRAVWQSYHYSPSSKLEELGEGTDEFCLTKYLFSYLWGSLTDTTTNCIPLLRNYLSRT